MIRIHGIKLNLNEDQDRLQSAAARKLHVSADDIEIVRIARMSLDAREKPVVYRVFSLDIKSRRSDDWLIKACRKSGLQYSDEKTERFEIRPLKKSENSLKRPVVAGFGPCGMFAALALAEYGLKPLVLERGGCMDERVASVKAFWNSGKLDPECNVQFGEGGAGTFSDGKLTTGTRSPYAQWILEQFVEAGASPEILYLQKPHIGTDVLRKVVVNIRKKIEALGGEILFNCKMESLLIEESRICGVNATRTVPGNSILNEEISNSHSSARTEAFSIQTDTVILALGHSARDTIRNLYNQGLIMEQKPFSMGVRIEHPQALIDMTQYRALHEDLGIGAADYKLNVKTLRPLGCLRPTE